MKTEIVKQTGENKMENLESELSNFTGTETYVGLYPELLLTEGAHYLAEKAKCFWLFDIVYSVIRHCKKAKEEGFLNVTMTVLKEGGGIFRADDGNDHVLYQQNIPYTDFPLDSYSFYVIFDGNKWVALLKSEY